MKLTKCSNGHFYDAEQFASCPHCAGAGVNAATVPFNAPGNEPGPTIPLQKSDVVRDDEVTIAAWGNDDGTSPVVGWLVCLNGKHYGEGFKLQANRNRIGRDSQYDVPLTGEQSVSRDIHAELIYDPMANQFIVTPGNSRSLCYVNTHSVITPVELHKNDVLKVGDVELMFIPCCDDKFVWPARDAAE